MNIRSTKMAALLVPCIGVLAQCGSNNEIGMLPDGGGASASTDAAAGDSIFIQGDVDAGSGLPVDAGSVGLPRPAACGGTVQTAGASPWFGSFNAQYISVTISDCPLNVTIIMAENSSPGGKAVMIGVLPNATTGSFLGHTAQIAIVDDGSFRMNADGTSSGHPGVSVGADVDISAFPARSDWLSRDTSGWVTGTFSIQTNSVSISGSFSSPLCDGTFCIASNRS